MQRKRQLLLGGAGAFALLVVIANLPSGNQGRAINDDTAEVHSDADKLRFADLTGSAQEADKALARIDVLAAYLGRSPDDVRQNVYSMTHALASCGGSEGAAEQMVRQLYVLGEQGGQSPSEMQTAQERLEQAVSHLNVSGEELDWLLESLPISAATSLPKAMNMAPFQLHDLAERDRLTGAQLAQGFLDMKL